MSSSGPPPRIACSSSLAMFELVLPGISSFASQPVRSQVPENTNVTYQTSVAVARSPQDHLSERHT